jgi:hypothetical protein
LTSTSALLRFYQGEKSREARKGGFMKKIVVLAVALCLAFAGLSSAQMMKWKGSGGWGQGTPYNRIYDPKTVETISGEVEKVEQITPMKKMSYGVHITVRKDKETADVHLGPGWFLENQDVKISAGDKVEIKASKVQFQGKPAFIASEVKKGDEVLKLRDENGIPVWSGWRRR